MTIANDKHSFAWTMAVADCGQDAIIKRGRQHHLSKATSNAKFSGNAPPPGRRSGEGACSVAPQSHS